jgi:Cu-processing system permease protein
MTSASRVVALCAKQERILAMRSRWTQTFAAAFGALALAVAVSGYVLSGGSGVQDFARTASSLVQLVVLTVPLTGLLLGALSLASDRGNAELLFSQPVPRGIILLGRVVGLFEALVAAQALGFGAAGVVIYAQSGPDGIGGFLAVLAASAVLTAICLGLAALIAAGTVGRRRSRALAIAIVTWVVLVLIFDIAALGAASLLRSGTASRLLITAAIVNPVDAVRTAALLWVEGTGAFGAASLALLRYTGGPGRAGILLGLSLLAWTIVPMALAARRLERSDI